VGKYDCLTDHLNSAVGSDVKLSFKEIDDIIKKSNNGDGLPKSAYKHRSWWGNETSHSQAKSWMKNGWEALEVKMKDYIVFKKINS